MRKDKAFPTYHYQQQQPGMDLRDYFAAKAMQALLTNPDKNHFAPELSQAAYEMADAMIRAKETE